MPILRYYSSVAQPTQLTGGISAGSTTMTVASTTGFPSNFPYTLAVDYGGSVNELVDVTAAAGLTLTITRAVDGTSAQSHSIGAQVRHVASGRDFGDYQTHQAASTAHGTGSAIVGINDAQTLTNKTLTGPVINGATVSGTVAGSPTFTGALTISGSVVAPLNVRGALAGDVAISDRVTGDTNDRYQVTAAGVHSWGPGNAALDLSMSRTAAGELTFDAASRLRLANVTDVSNVSTGHAFQIGPSSGANIRMDGNEIMAVNNGATATLDVQSDGGNLRLFNNTTAQLAVQGNQVVNNQTAGSIALQVNAAAAQSANLFEVKNTSTLMLVNQNGTTILSPLAAANVPLIVRGVAAQTADLINAQDSTPTTRFQVRADGSVAIANSSTSLRPFNVNGPSGTTANLIGAQVNSVDVFTVGPTGNVRVAGEDPGVNVTPSSGWSQVAIVTRRFGPIAAWSVIMQRTGGNISIAANGNISPDVDVFTTPTLLNPLASQFVQFNTGAYEGGAFLSSSTNICAIRSGTPSATIATGDQLGFTFCYAIA